MRTCREDSNSGLLAERRFRRAPHRGTVIGFGTVALIIFLLVPRAVQAAPDATIIVGNGRAFPGGATPIFVTARNDGEAVAAQFDVLFNTNKVSAGNAAATLASRKIVRSREIAPGVRRVLAYSLAKIPLTNRAFASIPFSISAKEYVGSGPIMPSHIFLARSDGTAIEPVSAISGQVFTRPVNRSLDGSVQFFLPSTNDSRYLIQASTNFVDWLTITNMTANADFMDLVDADAGRFPYRFYRPILYEAAGEITGVTRNANGFRFNVSGLDGRSYILQASTDLVSWTDVGSGAVVGGALSFDAVMELGVPWRFYRLRSGR